jgi:catechol 2,3-dioxygenase-like lactoylglutathione lyase family enzyme
VDEEVIPILRVGDAAAAAAWYAKLGFVQEWEHRFAPELPAFVSVVRHRAGESSMPQSRMRLFLSEHTGDARPDTLIYLRLANVNEIAAEFGVEVEDAPWAREIELRDPDGNRLRIGTPTPDTDMPD